MGRAPCCAKVGLRRGKWTAEEDEKLVSYIKANGEGSWRSMPMNAGLLRCGKSCRLRWINYLRDDLKRGNITPEEEEIIARLQASLGNRWSLIATHLVGRTDNEIKNYWNSHLSRKLQLERCPETPQPVKKKRGRKPKSASGTDSTDGKKPSRVRKLKQTSENLKKADVADREKKNTTTVGEAITTITGEPVSDVPVIAPVECSSGSTSSGEIGMRELEEMLSLDNLDGSTWNVGDVDYNGIWENIIDIPKRKLLCREDYEDVYREIQIMHHLSEHPNVVRIKGAYEDAMFVHIVMELCAGGELFDRIVMKGHYSERKAAGLIKTIVGVVEACHSLGVMHRDLKPENFLLLGEDEDWDSALKATDFGLSVFYKPGEIFTDVVGSPFYVAPEVLQKYYGPEVDVWSAGVILYILLSGVPPFWAETEGGIFKEILKGHLDFESEPWPVISESAKDLIRNMLNKDPTKRFTAHQVLCHPWIVDDKIAPDRPLDSAVLSRLKHFSAMNKLKKMALRVIAEKLSEEEIGGLKELFRMIDTDNSGTITFDELKTGLRRVGSELMESEIQTLMDAADIDNNGSLDYGEFIAATVHMNKMEREENLISAFTFFDKDGSGFITIDELQQACKEFGVSDVHLDEMIKEIDQNNDGQIDYNEFATMMRMGNGGIGRRTMRNNLNVNLDEVLRSTDYSNKPS